MNLTLKPGNVKKLEKLSKQGSFFIFSRVINDRQRGKIKDVAIFLRKRAECRKSELLHRNESDNINSATLM